MIYHICPHHLAESLHHLSGHRVAQFDLAVQRNLPEVIHQLHQALKLSGGPQHVPGALFLDTAVLHLTIPPNDKHTNTHTHTLSLYIVQHKMLLLNLVI